MSIQQGTAGGMPVLILKEGASQTKGRDAQKNNITAAKLIAEVVRSSLGPRGMDKMLVDSLGDVTITNDGATILKEIDVQHPAAKMMVEVAKSVDNEVGDGTTSAVVLAGALIEKAEELISKEVHPTVIVEGYQMASGESADLAKIVVQAVLNVAEERIDEREGETRQQQQQKKFRIDVDNIKVEKKAGGSLNDTQLIYGIVLDKEVVHGGMPKRIHGAKIALLNAPMEIEKTEMSAEIRISEPQQMQMFLEEENRMLKSMVDKVVAAGANIVLCQKGIDDIAQHYLSKAGIMAVRRIKESDLFKLAKATGARIVNNIDDLTSKDLGSADVVEERKVETDRWVFIEGCKNPKAVTILVRGGSQRVVDEADRSIHDAL